MRLLFIIDPPQTLKPQKDTSIALMQAALQRGWDVLLATCDDLDLVEGRWQVQAQILRQIANQPGQPWCELSEAKCYRTSDIDAILMRQDPPVDDRYQQACQCLAIAEQAGVPVHNPPHRLLAWNEKILPMHLDLPVPETMVSADRARLYDTARRWQDVILKPLDGMGGRGVMRFQNGDLNLRSALELLTEQGKRKVVLQRYLPAIQDGDKRLILIHGQPVEQVLARLPASDDLRGNLAAGGRARPQPLSASDRRIAQALQPFCRDAGLLLVGVDIIGHCVTEINITSPTCLVELSQACRRPLAGDVLDAMVELQEPRA